MIPCSNAIFPSRIRVSSELGTGILEDRRTISWFCGGRLNYVRMMIRPQNLTRSFCLVSSCGQYGFPGITGTDLWFLVTSEPIWFTSSTSSTGPQHLTRSGVLGMIPRLPVDDIWRDAGRPLWKTVGLDATSSNSVNNAVVLWTQSNKGKKRLGGLND